MAKKHIRYYIVTMSNSVQYRKVESDLPFSIAEGKNYIQEQHTQAIKIQPIATSKAELFLSLNK